MAGPRRASRTVDAAVPERWPGTVVFYALSTPRLLR